MLMPSTGNSRPRARGCSPEGCTLRRSPRWRGPRPVPCTSPTARSRRPRNSSAGSASSPRPTSTPPSSGPANSPGRPRSRSRCGRSATSPDRGRRCIKQILTDQHHSLQKESSVNARLTALASSICCLFLTSPAIGGQVDAAPVKKTVRADDGLNLVCEVRGHGGTALVFLHGWCGDREYWKHQANAFAADYRVVTLDQAGHGESGKDRKAWTANSLAADVDSVVKALGLKR